MKLKYYLRGLGVGIVVTALLSSISNEITDKDLTTEQIIQKALDFGMVKKDDYDVVNSDLSSAKKTIADLQNQLETVAKDSKDESDSDKEEEASQTKETQPENVNDTTTKQEDKEEPAVEDTTVQFSITEGMSAKTVSKLLQEKGIISDADDFNQYVIDTDNVKNLRVGEYEMKSGESYKTIINKLKGK